MINKHIRAALHPNVVLLFISALGSLMLSGANTYHIMASSGTPVALAAVMALETGLAGMVFNMVWRRDKDMGPVRQFLRGVLPSTAIVVVLLMLVTTNVLAKIDVLGMAVSTRVTEVVQVVVLGAVIPFLAFVSTHSMVIAYRRRLEEEPTDFGAGERKATSKAQRQAAIRDLRAKGHKLNRTHLAAKFGVSTTTITRDIEEIDRSEGKF